MSLGNRSWILIAFLAGVCPIAEANWHQDGSTRWQELPVPAQGRTGFTPLPPERTGIWFTNVLDDASSAANRVLENGSGVAVGDFDQDGRPDLFFCSLTGHNALYRNMGDWKFAEVSEAAGVRLGDLSCRGAVFADLNGDGWPDLLVSTLGHGVRCFMNDGHGHFSDATAAAGTGAETGSMTMALADVDGNGTLDLYVANYRSSDIRDRARIEIQRVNGQVTLAPWLRDRLILTPQGVLEFGDADALYLNDGHGHFQAVSWTGGAFRDEEGQPLTRAPGDWGLTATFRDLNGDGYPDLYVCNDYWTPDRVWINDGHGRFQAIPRLALRHTSENSMGVDFADLDGDGHLDGLVLDMLSRDSSLRRRQILAQTRMAGGVGEINNRPQIMRNTLFHNRGDGTFEEIADYAGIPASDWSWQPAFVDVDLDGYEDVIIPAGHRRDVQDLDATLRVQALQHRWPPGMEAAARQQAFTREIQEQNKLYPSLEMPVVAFRNLGHLRFEEVTDQWGTSALGVHQGIALADLDGDGDLDFVVNNLNGVAGVYRNDSAAPRIAVQLRGLPPNTEGIGATVSLLGGPVARQSREMVSGGRYLSGFQPMAVFAAGTNSTSLRLEVHWRSGKSSRIEAVQANRLYEIDEAGASPASITQQAIDTATAGAVSNLFEDVSSLLQHVHVENEFDDFARQPMLPRKLSQLGPGVAWFDLDGDGHEDLILGSGRGGHLQIYHNDGQGRFQTVSSAAALVTRDQTGLLAWRTPDSRSSILAGSANYEDGLTNGPSVRVFDAGGTEGPESFPGALASTGPLALADLNGSGSMELFVGGRVIPGRYPEPASSRLFRFAGGQWELDSTNSAALENVGLVSGAVWTDLDGDGWPDLVLACEWGPIRVFKNNRGHLEEITERVGLKAWTGWWTSVTAGDFDGDGRLDLVAGNWGRNAPQQASRSQPLTLEYGDLMQRGTVDIVETEFDPKKNTLVPRRRLDVMAAGLPFLRDRFTTFKSFSEASLDDVLGDLRARVSTVRAATLASMVFLNRGDHFEARELPPIAQFAPVFGLTVADFEGDGREDVFLAQNFFEVQPEDHRLDAGRGLLLKGDGTGRFQAVPGQESGIRIYGEQRGAATADFNEDGRPDLVITQNGAATVLLANRGARPGLRVRLNGPPGNSTGLGAVVRLRFGERWGPAREVHAGSGYWSQDGAVLVLARPEPATEVWVRWPGGKETRRAIPADAREVIVRSSAG